METRLFTPAIPTKINSNTNTYAEYNHTLGNNYNGNADNNNSTSNNLYELILKFCITCIEWTTRNDWTIVISKMGNFTSRELEEWESLLNGLNSAIFKTINTNSTFIANVLLACAHFNPRLQLLSVSNPADTPNSSSAAANLGMLIAGSVCFFPD